MYVPDVLFCSGEEQRDVQLMLLSQEGLTVIPPLFLFLILRDNIKQCINNINTHSCGITIFRWLRTSAYWHLTFWALPFPLVCHCGHLYASERAGPLGHIFLPYL